MIQNSPSLRFINRDGTLNVVRTPFKAVSLSDIYHSLLIVSWMRFLALIWSLYIFTNLAFAFGYYLCGREGLTGLNAQSKWAHFTECFFFSVQTLATIGYGRLSPAGLASNLLVTLEALVGLLGLALATGLIFTRFSRPTSRVLFSNVALITRIDKGLCLVFRMANQRSNQIVEARINVSLILDEVTVEGEHFRNFYDLELERRFSPIFAMTWLVVHPITEKSPLFEKTAIDLTQKNAEIVISLTGIDETFSQAVHSRFSYIPADLIWNARFQDMITRTSTGKLHLDLEKMHNIEKV